jgi:hypothetical protein
MNRAVVLNIRIATNADRFDIAPQYNPEPDAGTLFDVDVSDDDRSRCDKYVFSDFWRFPAVFNDHYPSSL